MKAVGNKVGKELYGSPAVLPSDSKERKVASCTKKYGSAQVQESILQQVALASERANVFITGGTSRAQMSEQAKPVSDKPRAFQMPSQDLLDLEFDTINLGKEEPAKIDLVDVLDLFDTAPPVGDLTSGISKSSSIPSAKNASSRAKEIFDDLEDFWASA
jgi:hypothetical protein